MMKVVLAVALLALLAIGVDATAQRLGMVQANALTLTSSDQITATGWTLTTTKVQTANYVGDGTATLETNFNVTFTGYLPTGYAPKAVITFSGAGGLYQTDSSCAGEGYSVSAQRFGNFLTYESSLDLRFLAAGTATATITIYWPPLTSVGSTTFTFPVVAPVYAPPTGNRPTIASFVLAGTFSSVNNVAANVTLANNAGTNVVTIVFTAGNNNQGVAYVTQAITTTGVIGNEAATWSTLTPQTGSWCGDLWGGANANTDLPTGTMLTVRSVTVSSQTGSTSYGPAASFLTGNNAISVTSGETDVTPPVCTGAAFATPLAVDTASTPISKALALACTDEMNGSGLQATGAFLRAVAGSVTYDFPTSGSGIANSIDVPLHYSGSVDVIGVWSMDGAGNTVVYGSCGATTTGAPESICGEGGGGSSSSTVIASISVVIACILAVLAL